jgi:hypothetical protein
LASVKVSAGIEARLSVEEEEEEGEDGVMV